MVLEYASTQLAQSIKERSAAMEVDQLPELKAFENQLRILFGALLDNSLKFSREGYDPIIKVTYTRTQGRDLKGIDAALVGKPFHCIIVEDNGIGFDNKYIDNIFRIFRRLHTSQSEYEGKGIGLAICQRIMTNHEGYIIGAGIPGDGAMFKLYFPA